MSRLLEMFENRRRAHFPSRSSETISIASSRTVSSYEISNNEEHYNGNDENSPGSAFFASNYNVVHKESNFRDRITNNYTNCFKQDSDNPAFFLSDKSVGLDKKMMFVLSRKWCWSILILFAVLTAFPYLVVTYNLADNLIKGEGRTMNRSSWGALDAKPGLDLLNTPILKIIVTQTFVTYERTLLRNSGAVSQFQQKNVRVDDNSSCTTEDECSRRVRELQIHYMEELLDIPFNFLVGDDGNIYEGRGFYFQGEIPRVDSVNEFVNRALLIAFIGDFTDHEPSENQAGTFFGFLNSSADRDLIDRNYVLSLDENSSASGLNETLRKSTHFEAVSSYPVIRRSKWTDPAIEVDFRKARRTRGAVSYIILSYYESSDCSENVMCMACLNNALVYSMDQSGPALYDIPYNFVVGGNGDVYECRGWHAQPEPILLFPPDSYIHIGIPNTTFDDEILELALNQLVLDGQMRGKVGESFRFMKCDKTCKDNIFGKGDEDLCSILATLDKVSKGYDKALRFIVKT